MFLKLEPHFQMFFSVPLPSILCNFFAEMVTLSHQLYLISYLTHPLGFSFEILCFSLLEALELFQNCVVIF